MELTPTKGATVKKLPIPSTGGGGMGSTQNPDTLEQHKQVQSLRKTIWHYLLTRNIHLDSASPLSGMYTPNRNVDTRSPKGPGKKARRSGTVTAPHWKQPHLPTSGMDKAMAMNTATGITVDRPHKHNVKKNN